MQSKTNYQSLISQLSQLSDEQIKRDYLNHLKWTDNISEILPLIHDEQALRLIRLGFDVDLMLGAFFAGKVKSELQSETVKWIKNLEIPDNLKIELLGRTKSGFAIHFLTKTFLNDKKNSIAEDAIRGLEKICGEVAIEALIHFLLDEDYRLSRSCAAALVRMGNEKGINLLFSFLNHHDANLRRTAVYGLKNISEQRTLSALIPLLHDNDVQVCREVVFAVGHIISPVDTAEETVNQFSENQRRNLAIALVKALDDEDEELRRRIAVVLKRIVDESILEDLIQTFEDGEQNLQADIARLLKTVRNKNSTELLVSILLDKNSSARENLIGGLDKFANESIISLLIQVVTEEKNPSAR